MDKIEAGGANAATVTVIAREMTGGRITIIVFGKVNRSVGIYAFDPHDMTPFAGVTNGDGISGRSSIDAIAAGSSGFIPRIGVSPIGDIGAPMFICLIAGVAGTLTDVAPLSSVSEVFMRTIFLENIGINAETGNPGAI